MDTSSCVWPFSLTKMLSTPPPTLRAQSFPHRQAIRTHFITYYPFSLCAMRLTGALVAESEVRLC